MKYCVVKGTTIVIDGSMNPKEIMYENAINAGYKVVQVEIITQSQYDERKASEPQLPDAPTEIDLLKEQAQTQNEAIAELTLLLYGGM